MADEPAWERARAFGDWLEQKLAAGSWWSVPPPFYEHWLFSAAQSAAGVSALAVTPILAHFSGSVTDDGEPELRLFLDSYFAVELALVPLSGSQYLLLLPAARDGVRGGKLWRSELLSVVEGVQTMLEQEWRQGCALAVLEQTDFFARPVEVLRQLRLTLACGLRDRPTAHVYADWQFELERWLLTLETPERQPFFDVATLNAETLETLEQFFAADCNLAHTARALHIHRNTLIYRLDKLKQESGLDVRSFHDAVKVRIGLLLVKQTKN
jgi:sugar diacid utilization regulator